jgi:5-methyltetrahydropteroyltriglutamate--homocysteine methyltransferase
MMTLQQNAGRILTTHVGSLPRPRSWLDTMKSRISGELSDNAEYDRQLREAVRACVAKQAECGIDILTDGEQSKPGFFTYTRERLEGFEPRPDYPRPRYHAEVAAFPEYYEQYFKEAMFGGAIAPMVPMVCTGPVRYRGHAELQRDIANLKAAAADAPHHAVFMPSVAPSGVGANEYYRSEEEFLHAVGAALHTEYQAIIDAGFLLQIDDPFLTDVFGDTSLDARQRATRATMYVETVNASLAGIPQERVRYHTCYGINEGPRIHEAALADVAGHMLQVNAGSYSFEAANPRHEH